MGRRGVSTILPDDFAPAQYTVLCGRGKEYTSSTGNLHLKSLVLKYLSGYSEAKSKVAKSAIVSEILSEIKGLCPDAAFVKMEDEAWREVDDAFAREKIGCIFRDTLHTKYRSSTKAKFARKKAKLANTIPSSSSTRRVSDASTTSTSRSTNTENIRSSTSGITNEVVHDYNSTLAEEIFGVQQDHRNQSQRFSNYYSLLSNYLVLGEQVHRPRAFLPQSSLVQSMCQSFTHPDGTTPFEALPDDISAIFEDL